MSLLRSIGVVLLIIVAGCTHKLSDREKRRSINEKSFPLDQEIAQTFEELSLDTPLEKVYEIFNQFCLSHFGAKTDSLYYTFGKDLKVEETDSWNYVSERSASMAWKTNLPAKTYVEYGKTKKYGQKTEIPERYFYNHVHYLKDLDPETRYFYRVVSMDERGNSTESDEMTFYTKKIAGAVHIPGELGKPPYELNRPNTTYIVTKDITAERSAFNIVAGGITLDLGGHTIIHADQLIPDLDHEDINKSGVGIRLSNDVQQSGLKVFNGTLKQGNARNNQDYLAGENMLKPDPERKRLLEKNMNRGFSNIEIAGQENVEIAGVTVEYHLPQTWGMRFDQAFGKYEIHHNVFLDKGTQMFDRHGAGGARSLGFYQKDLENNGNDMQVHHNLIKRTRQNAINVAQEVFDNEIYVDSWAVNSFAIQPSKEDGHVYDNKIFLTGYYSCGILWADKDLRVHDNFIHMESIKTMITPPNEGRRLIETWGEQDVLAGMRITNYGKGGQVRKNISYENNIILGRSRKGAEMRGTEFFSDYSIEDLVFKNNIVKIMAMDSITTKAACVDTQGAYNDRSSHLPLIYKNSTLISNICHIRLGDDYGQGSNHQFINCKLTRTGTNPNYHTFVFDGKNAVFNHVLLDCEFGEGTNYRDVYWNNTGSLSNYKVQWTLTISTNPGAMVSITDKNGHTSYSGKVGVKGQLSVPLTQSIIRPVEWAKEAEEVPVKKKHLHQEETFYPYTVSIEFNGKQKIQSLEIKEKTQLNISL